MPLFGSGFRLNPLSDHFITSQKRGSGLRVPKASPEERVGVFARAGGRTMVIEYSDLPEALARETDSAGHLRYDAGNVAIHLIGVPFAQRVATSDHGGLLPLHRADKTVPFIDPEKKIPRQPLR